MGERPLEGGSERFSLDGTYLKTMWMSRSLMRSHMAVTMAWTSTAVEVPLDDTAKADWLSTKAMTCPFRSSCWKMRIRS